TNPGSDNISLYRNLGVLKISTAQFATRVDVAVGDTPGRIYKGDFDSDGKIDLLLYHGGTSTTLLTVMHNTSTVGNISFNRIDLTNPSATTVATISDLDGDGKPEIITTSETGNRFSIFKNIHTAGALSAASFAAPFNTTVTAPRGITTADLNLDGKPEIIITRPGLLVVYENLISAVSPPTITSFTPASADVGTTITITGTNFDPTPANNVVYFGATRATVSAATITELTVTVPTDATYAPITELNTTSNLSAYSMSNFTPTFSPSKGSITSSDFEPKVDFTTGSNPLNVSIGDLDGDGKSDLAVANTASNTISVLRNTSTGPANISYATKVDFPSAADPESVSIGDFDGDGKADLAVANYIGFSVSVFRNTSTGAGNISYATKVDFATGFTHRSSAIADFDGDGKTDIVVPNDNAHSISVLRNTSTGPGTINYAAKVDFSTGAGSGPYSISVGDVDGDARPDVIAPNFNTSTVSILRNTSAGEGDISFATKVDFTTGTNPISVSVGDLDGDGKQDLAIVNKNSNSISVFRNTSTGAGNISYAAKIDFPVSTDPRSVSMGDLDGDGKADLAVVNDGSNAVSVLRNTSSGAGNIGFAAKVDFTTGASPRYVSIGDSDGDGKSDIITANANGNSVSVIRNNPVFASITINTQPSSISVCENGIASFTLTASGTTNLTYQWQKFDGAVFNDISNTSGYAGATTPTLTINTTGNFGEGDYRCIVSGDNATTVFSQTVSLALGSNTTVAEITVDGSTLTASPGDSYQWYQNGEEITGATNQTLNFNPLEYGLFTVAVTDNGCTTLSDEFTYLITGFEKNVEGLKFYPNPVEENLILEFKPPYTIQVIGIPGNVVHESYSESVSSTLDLTSLSAGLYFLKITNKTRTRFIQIIKK
ncbi:MAG TPA: T9SS type A sorting domain-containing protein, partial [Ohtaekwangia sp.]